VASIEELCSENGVWLIEDAAQAHGAVYRGKKAGGFGRLATWSFYPAKNLGCFGDGGAVTGDNIELLERVQRLANHGGTRGALSTHVPRAHRCRGRSGLPKGKGVF
jgi:dTDP-4-amino-4,6-dideoxygalactose transaminase